MRKLSERDLSTEQWARVQMMFASHFADPPRILKSKLYIQIAKYYMVQHTHTSQANVYSTGKPTEKHFTEALFNAHAKSLN